MKNKVDIMKKVIILLPTLQQSICDETRKEHDPDAHKGLGNTVSAPLGGYCTSKASNSYKAQKRYKIEVPIITFKIAMFNSWENYHSRLYSKYRSILNINCVYLYLATRQSNLKYETSLTFGDDLYWRYNTNINLIINKIKNEIEHYNIAWNKFIKNQEPKGVKYLLSYKEVAKGKSNGDKLLVRSKIVSRSYFKIKEIFNDIPLFPNYSKKMMNDINRMHIAEAPGGFIQFCNHFFGNENYCTISMKSNSKMIPSYKLSKSSNHQINFLNNDITNYAVINYLIENHSNKYNLVTSDGGIFLNNQYLYQEHKSFNLIACELFLSLFLLKNSGSIIIKFFDTFTKGSLLLLSLIRNNFEDVFIHKPCYSRTTNSEKYIIGLNFKKNTYDEKSLLLKSLNLLRILIFYEQRNCTNLYSRGWESPQRWFTSLDLLTPHNISDIILNKNIQKHLLAYNSILSCRQGCKILEILDSLNSK